MKDKLANIECNVASVVRITDHFYRKMVENRTPGAIAFAASSVRRKRREGGGKRMVKKEERREWEVASSSQVFFS